jgi:DhnA family fructose-bisphosphate aldolase class Ia
LNILPEVHFAPNQYTLILKNIKLAMEAGCNAIASTMGLALSRKYAHKIPFV